MVVARRRGVMGGGTTAHVGWRCTSVRGTGEGKRMGMVEEEEREREKEQARAPGCEKRRKGLEGEEGKRRVGVPVTARYGSLSDQCRYRVAVSPEFLAQSSLRHFSLARLFRGDDPLVAYRCVPTRSLATLSLAPV